MPYFRCTSCHRSIESPVVIGAGDCPHCGGDVVFDVHREQQEREKVAPPEPERPRVLQELMRRLRRR
jgi:predicted RNA-binding Zn-ribbon protein involved in translation (DUF1610 family)